MEPFYCEDFNNLYVKEVKKIPVNLAVNNIDLLSTGQSLYWVSCHCTTPIVNFHNKYLVVKMC